MPSPGKSRSDSYIEVRLLAAFALAVLLLTLLIPAIVRAVDANGDNLEDSWEARYGITTNAYAATNLAGWWQLDGPTNVADRSDNQINGSLSGFPPNAFGPGLFNQALYFGPKARVDFPAKSALDMTNGMTFSTWFKSTQGATNQAVIATWVDGRQNSWSVGIETNGMAEISFADSSGNVQTVGPSTNSPTLYDGAWHHLAATFSPQQSARVYVDGENVGSEMIEAWNPGPVASFSFGTPDDSINNQTYVLDETRLYNRALGPNEITQLPVTYTELNGDGLTVWEAYQRGIDPTTPITQKTGDASNKSATDWTDEPTSSDFTPWMTDPELHTFLAQFDTTPPGNHPNYWDKGHWINAVEGRWHNGAVQFRITYGAVPKHKGLWWYWYLGIGEEQFNQQAKNMAATGFTLLDANSFVRPDGSRAYQGVWHKVIPPNHGATAAKPDSTQEQK